MSDIDKDGRRTLIYHLVDDTGGGGAFCGNCNHCLDGDPLQKHEQCPKCGSELRPNIIGPMPYSFGGSDF